MSRRLAAALVLTGAVFLSGCERGCLSSWFKARGIDQAPTAFGGKGGPLAPRDTPCPSGLARCSGGIVRVSRSFTPPTACSPEGCRCPWDDAATCARGCALEAIELEMPREVAVRQLCAPAPDEAAFSRLPSATETAVLHHEPRADAGEDEEADDVLCDVERYRCTDGIVIACHGGAHAVAVCSAGCADGERMIFADASDAVATVVLCKR
jgi:hypothetical protein